MADKLLGKNMSKKLLILILLPLFMACDMNPVDTNKKIEKKLVTNEVIFFSSDRDENATNIYMMNTEGEIIKKITNFESGEYVATAVSPDSNLLLFYESWPGFDIDVGVYIYIYKMKEEEIIGPISYGDPGNFSPDGKKFVFSKHTSSAEGDFESVFLYDLENHSETKLTEDGKTSFYPQISPNGKIICYESAKFMSRDSVSCWQLHIMDINGNFISDLTLPKLGYYAGNGVFTPDNISVVFHYMEMTWCYDICIVDINTKEIRYLTQNRFNGRYDITSNYYNPNVSYDGTKVYFFSRPYLTDYPHPTDIYSINIDGSGLNNITNANSSDSHPVSGICTYYVEE